MTRKYLTQDEVYKLMDAAQSMSFPERNRCLIMMAFIHGFRPVNFDLRLSDIDASGNNLIFGVLKMVSRQHILFFLMNII